MPAHPTAIRSAQRCQARRKAAGLCLRCGQARGESHSKHYCPTCHVAAKAHSRNAYRLKKGIPLSKPLHGPRFTEKHRLLLDLEAAFRAAIARHPATRHAA